MLANCLELNSKGLYQSSGKEKESCCLRFPSLTKPEIRHFHVVVMQWRQRNVQKSVMHVRSFCFATINILLFFCRSSCRRRCLSSLILLATWWLWWRETIKLWWWWWSRRRRRRNENVVLMGLVVNVVMMKLGRRQWKSRGRDRFNGEVLWLAHRGK